MFDRTCNFKDLIPGGGMNNFPPARSRRIPGLVLLLALILPATMMMGSAALAVAPDQVEKAMQPPRLFKMGGACGWHTWVHPAGGAITIRDTSSDTYKTLLAQLDFGGGDIAYCFCTDIHHRAGGNRTYCLDEDFFSDWRIAWLATNYPPIQGDRVQHAARQGAIWHFSDGFDLDQSDPTTEGSSVDNDVKDAYNAILAAIPDDAPAEYEPGNVALVIDPAEDTNFLPGEEIHPFTVILTKGGQPLEGYTVNVSSDFGALDKASDVTNSDGEATFTLTSGSNGTANILAGAAVTLPAGSRFIDRDDPDEKQRLVLGEEEEVTVEAPAMKTWTDAENLIIAHKFEDKDFNGVQDAGEPDLDGWEFTLTVPGGTTHTGLTDSSGNAYFPNKVSGDGTYTLAETLKSGWKNSTPLSEDRERSAGDPWTQWAANFGNAQCSLITIIKFEDLDEDGEYDEGIESTLPGWQFALYDWVSGAWHQLDGDTTDPDGIITFTDLPTDRQYKIVENLAGQTGCWVNTTPLEQTVTWEEDEESECKHVYLKFGNRRCHPTPTNTPTHTPTDTPTHTPTNTPTDTPTNTPTKTPTDTPTNTPTHTPTDIPTNTPTNTPTMSPTSTPSGTPTVTPEEEMEPTSTPTGISTQTPTSTPTTTATPTTTRRHQVQDIENRPVTLRECRGNLTVYNVPQPGDMAYEDAGARNPSPVARDFWCIPKEPYVITKMTEVDIGDGGNHELAVLMDEDSPDHNLYLFDSPVPGDWTYWDAASRNPSPFARDLWMIPGDNDTALIADGGISRIASLRNQGGDFNLYLYNSPIPGDWNYWDAASRNPSPRARDLWTIPHGNDAVAMCGMDTTGNGESDSLLVVRDEWGDYNVYLWNMPSPGDWTYWDAVSRNPSPLARDFWSIPRRDNILLVSGLNRGVPFDELGVLEDSGEHDYYVWNDDQNFYLWNAPRPGDWTYWDAISRNPSPLARDLWMIPFANNTCAMAAPVIHVAP